MARKKPHEDHINHEAWAIPYGDLITLLLAFFVVMYAISSINEGKYRVLADAMSEAFNGPPKSLKPIQFGTFRQRGTGVDQTMSPIKSAEVDQSVGGTARDLSHPSRVPPLIKTDLVDIPQAKAAKARAQLQSMDQARTQLANVGEKLEKALKPLIDAKLVKVKNMDYWLEVEVRADILFGSGSAELVRSAYPAVNSLGQVLGEFPNKLRVEGHTDNLPISTRQFPSNWELSASRAASVARHMIADGIDPRRLSIMGYGEHWPIMENDSVEGRNHNRRVTLVVLGDGNFAGRWGGTNRTEVQPPAPAGVEAHAPAAVQASQAKTGTLGASMEHAQAAADS